jgi:hypothetical protein
MGRDRLGDALAADEPSTDQLVRISAVRLGAGRADRGAAITARGIDHAIRQVAGVRRAEHFPGGRVNVVDMATQADRPRAPTDGGSLGQPGRIVVASSTGQRRDKEAGIRHGHRLR